MALLAVELIGFLITESKLIIVAQSIAQRSNGQMMEKQKGTCTAFETVGGSFDDGRYSTEMISSGFSDVE